MKIISFIVIAMLVALPSYAAETLVPLNRLNWSQSLPLNANIILNGGNGIYMPQAYGAVGDGVTDDTTALQAAIAAAGAASGVMYLPVGTYKKNARLNLTSNLIIRGEGTIVESDHTHGFHGTDIENVTIEGIKLIGYNDGTLSAASGIVISDGERIRIEDVVIEDYDYNGMWMGCINNSSITKCRTENNGRYGSNYGSGIILGWSGSGASKNTTVTECKFIGNGDGTAYCHGLYVSGDRSSEPDVLTEHIVVTNNIAINNSGAGIKIVGDKCIVAHNAAYANGYSGIYSEASRRCIIDDNMVNKTYAGTADYSGGIVNSLCSDMIISRCMVSDTNFHGISTTGSNITISDNKIWNCGGYGIYASGAHNSTFENNWLNRIGSRGIYILSSLNTNVIDNYVGEMTGTVRIGIMWSTSFGGLVCRGNRVSSSATTGISTSNNIATGICEGNYVVGISDPIGSYIRTNGVIVKDNYGTYPFYHGAKATTYPTAYGEGDTYFNTTSHKLMYYTGSAWADV